MRTSWLKRIPALAACATLMTSALVAPGLMSTAGAFSTYMPGEQVVASGAGIQHLTAVPLGEGKALAVWEINNSGVGEIWASNNETGTWSTPEALSTSAQLDATPSAAVMSLEDSTAVVGFVASNGVVYLSTFDGTGFGENVVASDSPMSSVQVVSNGTGIAQVTMTMTSPDSYQVVTSRWNGTSMRFTGSTGGSGDLSTYPSTALCSSGDVVVAWVSDPLGAPEGSLNVLRVRGDGQDTYMQNGLVLDARDVAAACTSTNVETVVASLQSSVGRWTSTGTSHDWTFDSTPVTSPHGVRIVSGAVTGIGVIGTVSGRSIPLVTTGDPSAPWSMSFGQAGSDVDVTTLELPLDGAGDIQAIYLDSAGHPRVWNRPEGTVLAPLVISDSAALEVPVVAWARSRALVVGLYDVSGTPTVISTPIDADLPGAPDAPIVEMSPTSATLTVAPNFDNYDGNIVRYAVKYSTDAGGTWDYFPCFSGSLGASPRVCAPRPVTRGCAVRPIARTSHCGGDGGATLVLHNLQPGLRYYFKVAAVTAYGEGAFSNVVGPYAPWGPPGAVRHLAAKGTGKGAMTLTWRKPANTGGVAADYYQIKVRRAGRGHNYAIIVRQSFERSYRLTGLVQGANYWVRVRTVNARGLIGPWTRLTPKVHV